MSRSNYDDDCDNWELIRWRGAVTAALQGRRGQAFLRELVSTLDAMTHKRLIADKLELVDGDVCALGAVGRARLLRMDDLDEQDVESVAARFGLAEALVRELTFINDEDYYAQSSPESRWRVVRDWALANIRT